MNKHNSFFQKQTIFEPKRRNQWECQYRIPNLLVSGAGTIFALPEERVNGVADCSKHHLVMRRSFDCGESWKDVEVLFADDNPRVSHSYSGGVADVETGRVFVFFRVGVVVEPDDIDGAWPEKWRAENPHEAAALAKKLAPDIDEGLYVIWTDDEGESWSRPQPIGKTLHIENPVTGDRCSFGPQFSGIQLRNGNHKGRLVIPGRGYTRNGSFALYAYSHNYVIYSDDHGGTWHPGGLAQTGTGEACVVELSDGAVYLNSRNESLRCRGYRAWDRSSDGGQTFTESGYDLSLPEPHCAASIARYSDHSNRILFCNPAVHSDTTDHYDHGARRNLTVRLSEDDCRNWSADRTVCNDRAGYSALAVAQDGTVLCAYETLTEESYSGTIVLARFNLEWITG